MKNSSKIIIVLLIIGYNNTNSFSQKIKIINHSGGVLIGNVAVDNKIRNISVLSEINDIVDISPSKANEEKAMLDGYLAWFSLDTKISYNITFASGISVPGKNLPFQ